MSVEPLSLTIRILAGILVVISLIPLIRRDHWTFRVFEFPRFQKWVINLAIALAYIGLLGIKSTVDWVFLALLIVNFGYLTYQIYPYLAFAKKQIQDADKGAKPDIRLLIYNVYQYNENYEKLCKLVNEIDSDMVLLVETNEKWKDKSLEGFGEKYPHKILEDRENTYGMLIFSKFPLHNVQVRHLINEEVPSIALEVESGWGERIKFYAIHPEPPVPGENPRSTDRDAEILIVGKEAEKEELPVIVAGDLNDVAWSYTSILFQKISGLQDPRRGRGFFSSFHAKYPLLRWPLDHIFCSGHFRVHSMKSLKGIGSDHFPILIELELTSVDDESEEMEVDGDDKETANEKIAEGR